MKSWLVPGQRRMEIMEIIASKSRMDLSPETPGTSAVALSHVSHLAATRIARLSVGRS